MFIHIPMEMHLPSFMKKAFYIKKFKSKYELYSEVYTQTDDSERGCS